MVTARSSRSSRSVNREVEAWRTDRTHGWARPLVARRRRGRGRSSPPAPAARRWWSASTTARRRSGPCRTCPGRGAAAAAGPASAGRPTRSAASRSPGAPGCVVARRTASTTIGTPAASASASTSSRLVPGAELARLRVAAVLRQLRGSGGDVTGQAGAHRRLVGDALADDRAQLVDALPRRRRGGQHGHPGQTVGLEQSAYVVEHARSPVLGHLVDVVDARRASRPCGWPSAAGTGRGPPRRRTSAGRAPRSSGRSSRSAGRPRGGGSPRWSRGRAGRAAPARRAPCPADRCRASSPGAPGAAAGSRASRAGRPRGPCPRCRRWPTTSSGVVRRPRRGRARTGR